jgi:DNA-binding IclR family transcriptional regulator
VFDATGAAVAGVGVCINKALLGADRGERHRAAVLDVARTLTQRLGGEAAAPAASATRYRKPGARA